MTRMTHLLRHLGVDALGIFDDVGVVLVEGQIAVLVELTPESKRKCRKTQRVACGVWRW